MKPTVKAAGVTIVYSVAFVAAVTCSMIAAQLLLEAHGAWGLVLGLFLLVNTAAAWTFGLPAVTRYQNKQIGLELKEERLQRLQHQLAQRQLEAQLLEAPLLIHDRSRWN